MWKVVICDYYYKSLAAEVLDYHCTTEEKVISVAKDCDALICQFAPITKWVIQSLNRCKVIVRYAIGVDNIDLKTAEEQGITACNVPDYSIDEVSNHTIALLLDCAKKLTFLAGQARQGQTSYGTIKPLFRMEGRTLGLMGFGRIPRMVARKMAGFGIRMIAFDSMMDHAAARKLHVTPVGFQRLLEESNYLSSKSR